MYLDFIDRNLIFLIVDYLSFDDILNLSKTCLTFNKMLKHKYNSIWDLCKLRSILQLKTSLKGMYSSQSIVVSDIGLRKLPSEIGLLTNLRYLYLYKNPIETLPLEITKLTNLFILYKDARTKVPPEIRNMKKLSIW
jgi:Leucine-rich repeat (LRR) protein